MFTLPSSRVREFLRSEGGPTTVEYAVMLALVVALVIAVVAVIGNKTAAVFSDFDGQFNP